MSTGTQTPAMNYGADQYNSYNPYLVNPTPAVGPLHLGTTNPLAAGIQNFGNTISQGIRSLDQNLNSLVSNQPAVGQGSGFSQFQIFVLLAVGIGSLAYIIGQGEHHRR